VHFLNPNYHVILIHYPLGVFMLGLTIEIFSFLWKNSSIRVAARWMILLGGLATLPAATSGIYALSDVTSNLTSQAEHMLRMHVWLQSIATLLATFTAVFALAASDGWRRRFHLVALGIFATCGGLMVVGAWYAGESVYTQGVAVRLAPAPGSTETKPAVATDLKDKITFYTGEPIQIHMILAGVMFALAMASLGLSIRKITADYPDAIHLPLMPESSSSDAADRVPLVAADAHRESPAPQFAPLADLPEEPFVPAGRFWLIAALLALLTAAGGYWIWANDGDTWAPHSFWYDVMANKNGLKTDRAAVHVWLGISLILLPLLLAAFSRWAPRQKIVLAVFASLLVLVVSAQVFLGVLLTFDGGSGPLYRFAPPDKDSAAVAPAQFGSTFSRSSV
jgi:uncharacterized membrane protein